MRVIQGNLLGGGNRSVEITVADGLIKEIVAIEYDSSLSYITPGLVDLQVNGYMNIDFNNEPLSPEEWRTITRELSKNGVTTFYPTIITNSIINLQRIFEGNLESLKKEPDVLKYIGGFHLEGPYLSDEDGPRGAHDREFIKKPDWEEFKLLQQKAEGLIKIITLSPEWEESEAFIQNAAKSGVKVAIGHTASTTDQIKKAVQSGATFSTHLGNGAHLQLPRHPNYIWDQLAEEKLWATVIADGYHLPENVLRVIKEVKKDKMVLISDSVALAGMPAGDYQTAVGGEVTLTQEGRLHLKGNPALLAGSAQSLWESIQQYVDNGIGSMIDAIRRGSVLPSDLMGLPQKEGLSIGAPADLLKIRVDDGGWKIESVYKYGERVSSCLP
ncbi:amidohydrolase family protein [Lederbergia citrisecunda]|uniref:N-acetylglucosamine-6-phosphate deacetylase n=1 Tax=Lederbergia citrisecunda TaxID=2833583 RepID=UPI003D27A85B